MPEMVSRNAASEGSTFAVDSVDRSKCPLTTVNLDECLELRANVSVLEMPDRNTQVLVPEGYGRDRAKGVLIPYRSIVPDAPESGSIADLKRHFRRQKFFHPLIEAVHLAFSDHRPLILSPDSIWLTIVQGFGHHVLMNAERFRSRIVMHTEQQALKVIVRDSSIAWPLVIAQFSEKMREHSDPVLYETLLCEFSTTTPKIKTAYEVALMDAYQRYFKYELECICGIPEITVEGSPEDWRRMRERLEVLATYDLRWWTSRLTPILEAFEATASGSPDHAFWQAIYKPEEAYADRMATGWIADLFPYVFGIRDIDEPRDESVREPGWSELEWGIKYTWYPNPILATPRVSWLPVPTSPSQAQGVSLDKFPSGLSCAPLKVTFGDEPSVDIQLMGGFFGVNQREADYALSPVISWAAVEEDLTVKS